MATFNAPPWTPDMDKKSATFGEKLEREKYAGTVDDLGWMRWGSDWRQHVGNGCDGSEHGEATRRVFTNIDEIRAGQPPTVWPAGAYDVPWPPSMDTDAPVFCQQLRALYATHQHRPVDYNGYVRWSSDYRIGRANGYGHASVWAKIEREILTIWGIEPPPLPVPVHPFPLRGRLRLQGTVFVHDDGAVNPCFAHAGDLFALYVRDKQRATDEMSKMTVVGYHGARVWTLLGGEYWEKEDRHVGPDITPDYWPLWDEFLQEMHARKLRLVVSQGDIGQLDNDSGSALRDGVRRLRNSSGRTAFAQRMARAALDCDGTGSIYAFFDGGNEAWQTGEPDPERLAEFVQAYKDAGGTALLTLTSPPGEEKAELDAYSIAPADCFDVHSYRGGHWYDKRRHIFSIPYEGKPNKKNGIGSEPPGNGDLVSVTDNKDELNHEAVACLAAMSFIGRMAFVWFSGEGVRIQQGLETQEGFEACPRISQLLPRDVMSFATMHHSGNSWERERVLVPPDDVVRIDGATHTDGRFAYVLDGPAGTHSLRVQRDFTGSLINPATGEAVAVEGRAGQTLSLSWERGRVLVGRKL